MLITTKQAYLFQKTVNKTVKTVEDKEEAIHEVVESFRLPSPMSQYRRQTGSKKRYFGRSR